MIKQAEPMGSGQLACPDVEQAWTRFVNQNQVDPAHSSNRVLPSQTFQWTLPVRIAEHHREQVLLRGLHACEIGWARRTSNLRLDGGREHDVHSLVFCPAGPCSLDAGDINLELGPREAAMLPAGTSFSLSNVRSGPATAFWLRFTGEDSNYYVRTLGAGLSTIALSASASDRLLQVFFQLGAALTEPCTELRLIHASHLTRLLLSHVLGEKVTGLQGEAEPLHPGVEAAVAFMQDHLDESLCLGQIARQAGLSISHFCALFRNQMDVTPMDYLVKLKLQRARRLLVTTALTVQEIAQEVGYEDRYYFSRLFRKVHGVPPVSYRRKHQHHEPLPALSPAN